MHKTTTAAIVSVGILVGIAEAALAQDDPSTSSFRTRGLINQWHDSVPVGRPAQQPQIYVAPRQPQIYVPEHDGPCLGPIVPIEEPCK